MEPIPWINFNFHFGSEYYCFYCGEKPESTDHVIPNSFLTLEDRLIWDRGIFTPACQSCNATLSNKIFPTLQKRCEHVQARIHEKSVRALRCQAWDGWEISKLKYSLRSKILAMVEKKNIAKRRTEWKLTRQFTDLWEQAYEKAESRHPNNPHLLAFMAHPWQKTPPPSLWDAEDLACPETSPPTSGSVAAS